MFWLISEHYQNTEHQRPMPRVLPLFADGADERHVTQNTIPKNCTKEEN